MRKPVWYTTIVQQQARIKKLEAALHEIAARKDFDTWGYDGLIGHVLEAERKEAAHIAQQALAEDKEIIKTPEQS